MMLKKCIFIGACFFASLSSAESVVRVFNWGGYITQAVLTQFTHETGIEVEYTLFAENAELYTKLKLNPGTYDVIFPSSYMTGQMVKEGLLLPLDFSRLPNVKNLNPQLLNFAYDPQSKHSLPFTWGSVGIAINTARYSDKTITRWDDLWQPRFLDQLLVVDEARVLFNVALMRLGYSINDETPAHIEEAYHLLQALLPNIKLFNEEQETSIYADDDAAIGIALNGDVYRAQFSNHDIHYIYPAGKALLWIDDVAIPRDAPHIDSAYAFINFIMRPDVAAAIAKSNMFSTPNVTAIKRLPRRMRESPILYPSAAVLAHAEVENDLSEPTKILMESYWERLKLQS